MFLRFLLFLSVLISFLIAFGMRFINEDLFVAFCSGRDTLAGLLAAPDQWSFTTSGKVWVDQSWFSHLIYYLFYRCMGDLGPVILKAALLCLVMALIYRQCRDRGASPETSLICLAGGTLALVPFVQIRAENFGLLLFVLLTTLLTASYRLGRFRQVGCVAVMTLWANCHGSFMLGLALLGMRFVVDLAFAVHFRRTRALLSDAAALSPRPPTDRDGRGGASARETDPTGWFVALAAACFAVTFVNPYGIGNLLMPFRQLSATTMTGLSADWVPLFDFGQIWARRFFQPLDVKPFLVFALLTILLAVGNILSVVLRKGREALCGKDLSPERLMLFLIPLVMFPLVVKFRRMIVFAAPSLVPVAAIVMETYPEILRQRVFGKDPDLANRRMKIAATCIASAWLLFLTVIFLESTLRPYLPSNPMRRDRPVVSQLMSFDSYNMDVADFMKRNRINGRLFTSWTASVFLLFNVPDVQVFMDCRDQSIYSDEVMTTYFRVLNSRPEDIQESLKIVDAFNVDYMILATNPQDFRLATLFMESSKWGCIYKDAEFFVLARTDSEKFGPLFRSGTVDGVWYPSPETRSVSQSVMLLFLNRDLPRELMNSLKDYVQSDADPNLYSLLTLAMNGRSPCLNSEAESFLTSEISRLSSVNYLSPDGAKIVQSMLRIAGMLEGNSASCRSGAAALPYSALKARLSHVYQALEANYRGY